MEKGPTRRLDDRTRALLLRAERSVPARAANEEIDRERRRNELAHGRALSYEVVLGPEHGFAYLATVVAPRLARYLRDKKRAVFACDGVFVSLFVDDVLYFVAARELFAAIREAEGLEASGWRARVALWEDG